jgi:hypothetical protein
MARPGVLPVLLLALLTAGCMISEQTGQLVPDGNPRYWDQKLGEVTFHFDSTWNRVAIFGRSALLALLALWIFRSESGGKRLLTFAVGIPLLVVAAWLVAKDLPSLRRYKIAALEHGLVVEIPPDLSREVPWRDVDSMDVTGWELKRGAPPPGGANPFTDVPEWERMQVHTTAGDTIDVDLKRLSWEQRQSVWKAIAVRAHLVERK